MTVPEMYLKMCAPQEMDQRCERCAVDTRHLIQYRLFTQPNVLVVQVVRGEGVRAPVSVDEQLELPGLSDLELIGVVYHNGITTHQGHYT